MYIYKCAIFRPQGRKSTAKFRYFPFVLYYFLPIKTQYPSFVMLPPNKPFSSVSTAECMISYIICLCQYDTVPKNLSGTPQHDPLTMHEKFNLFVCQQLVFFDVPLLNVHLTLGLG